MLKSICSLISDVQCVRFVLKFELAFEAGISAYLLFIVLVWTLYIMPLMKLFLNGMLGLQQLQV